jgi:hypothetical protein
MAEVAFITQGTRVEPASNTPKKRSNGGGLRLHHGNQQMMILSRHERNGRISGTS